MQYMRHIMVRCDAKQYGVNIFNKTGEIMHIYQCYQFHVRLLIRYQRAVDQFNKKISHVFLEHMNVY